MTLATRHPLIEAGIWSIEAISDGRFSIPSAHFLRGETGSDSLDIDVNAFLLRRPDRPPVLVDAGLGPGRMAGLGHLAAGLDAEGISPGSIHTVLVTHCHPDHIGGLVDAAGQPAFPNAVLAVPREERRYWTGAGASADPQTAALAAQVFALYDGRIVDADGSVLPQVVPVSLPGHTPGHTGFRIGTEDKAVLIWGDILNDPVRQSADPDIGVASDVDPALAAATRREALTRAADDEQIVAGMHIGFPGFARVARAGRGFRLAPVQ